ncbi:MAG: isoprenylcysteine carboxylmethyltransferase family protein [Ignavibacteriales bacterium]|nr:isoprenylcysteine carboxylmethyltransferase family protein [Ignavibacteriales bacterium]
MSDIRQFLFRYRSYTPIPFLIAMVLFAVPTTTTMLCGFVLSVLGESLRYWGVAYAGSLTRVTGSVGAPEVVVAGPFAHLRNPLYAGNVLMYSGIGVMANALSPWLVLIALVYFAFQYAMIVSLEEEFLEKEFGEGYLEFKKHVPRFLPRLNPYQAPAQEHQKPDWTDALRSERRTLQALSIVVVLLLVIWMWR